MVLLAHISDLHVGGGVHAAGRVERVLHFLDGMARPMDAVLVTGDLTEHGLEGEYEELRTLLGSRRGLLLCPGNHDTRGPYRAKMLDEPASDEPINGVHDVAGVRVVMCDSSVPGRDDGYLADDTLRWLDAVLAETPATTPVLVALHHPPVLLHSPFIDGIRQYGAERLEALLERHEHVVAVLCGHAHTPAVSSFAGRPLVVAPAVASTLRLPWENDLDLDYEMPPALAFHVLDESGRLTTHYRLVT
jgi:3',5'-cyclic AMP phosphodiesterase CpdA